MLCAVAMMACSVAFAVSIADGDQNANVDLTLSLTGNTEAAWHATAAPTLLTWDTNKLVDDSDQPFDPVASDTIDLWAAVKSNENVKLKLEVSGEALNAAGVPTFIAVNAVVEDGKFGTSSVSWEGDTVSENKLSMQEDGSPSGLRVFTGKITFSMDQDDFAAAVADDSYSADVTLTVSTVD